MSMLVQPAVQLLLVMTQGIKLIILVLMEMLTGLLVLRLLFWASFCLWE